MAILVSCYLVFGRYLQGIGGLWGGIRRVFGEEVLEGTANGIGG